MRDPDPPPRLQTTFPSAAQPQQMTVSPKRKRGPCDPMQPFAPRLNTSALPSSGAGPIDVRSANTEPHSAPGPLLAAAAAAESGSESPRSRVASQFELLQINKSGYGLPAIDFGSSDTAAVATKKAKHNEEVFAHHPHTPRNEDSRTPHMGELSPLPQPVQEIAETPQHIAFASDAVQLTPPPPSSSPSVKLFLSTRRPNPKLHRRSPSPSVRSFAPTSSSTASAPVHLPDQAALTWQNSEITGHEIDRERDDDGYGINGIGFRPTHQVAQQRALKRRQQILEWRARQAREDRQKRSERRRLGALAPERKIGETQKRVVRFA